MALDSIWSKGQGHFQSCLKVLGTISIVGWISQPQKHTGFTPFGIRASAFKHLFGIFLSYYLLLHSVQIYIYIYIYILQNKKKKRKGNHQRVSFYSQYYPSHLLILKIVLFVFLAISFPLYFFSQGCLDLDTI